MIIGYGSYSYFTFYLQNKSFKVSHHNDEENHKDKVKL